MTLSLHLLELQVCLMYLAITWFCIGLFYFTSVYVGVLFARMSVHHVYAWYPWRPEAALDLELGYRQL